MSLWKRGAERTEETKRSDELCKKRDDLMRKFPGVEKEWDAEDCGPVRAAAEELSIVEKMANRDRIVEARKVLQLAIWKRDGIKEAFQRSIDALNGTIENINRPVIFEKCSEWQNDLASLGTKKTISVIEKWTNIELGPRVAYKSNFSTLASAKEKLIVAISSLKGMSLEPLSKILAFIDKIENELKSIDFSKLVDAGEVSDLQFEELSADPEVVVYSTARMMGNKIQKDYNPPVKEYR